MKIKLEHLTRIEGHAHLNIDANSGEVIDCRLDIFETPRFFEAILKGQKAADIAPLVARICGICSHSHSLVSLAATEKAASIEISPQTVRLRHLLLLGELIQSHVVHLYFMALPDYLGIDHLFEQGQNDLLERAMRLKQLGSELCRIVGGRAIHPLSLAIGGFSILPDARELKDVRGKLVAGLGDLAETVTLFSRFEFEKFERETGWAKIASTETSGYPLFGETIESSSGSFSVGDSGSHIAEFQPEHSNAKHAWLDGDEYRVGPLVRVVHGFEALSDMAQKATSVLNFSSMSANPFATVSARLIEIIHAVEESIQLINDCFVAGLQDELLPEAQITGKGTAVIEAPRGILFHSYEYEKNRMVAADCIIPTAQNLSVIESDLRLLAPSMVDREEGEMKQTLERLVRAYDPCVSCSTHLMKINIKR